MGVFLCKVLTDSNCCFCEDNTYEKYESDTAEQACIYAAMDSFRYNQNAPIYTAKVSCLELEVDQGIEEKFEVELVVKITSSVKKL